MSSEIPFSLVYMLHRASCCVETHPFFSRPAPFPPTGLSLSLYIYIPPASNTSVSLYAHTHVTSETIHPDTHASPVSVAHVTHTRAYVHVYNARRLGARRAALHTYTNVFGCGREGGQGGIEISRPVGRCSTCMLRARPME